MAIQKTDRTGKTLGDKPHSDHTMNEIYKKPIALHHLAQNDSSSGSISNIFNRKPLLRARRPSASAFYREPHVLCAYASGALGKSNGHLRWAGPQCGLCLSRIELFSRKTAIGNFETVELSTRVFIRPTPDVPPPSECV